MDAEFEYIPRKDAQSFLVNENGIINQWIIDEKTNLDKKWTPAIVSLRLLNLIHEKLSYILANKADPLLVLEYIRKSEPEKYDALFLKSQFTTQMAHPHSHLKIKALVLKGLFKLIMAEAGRSDDTSRRMLESLSSILEKEIQDIEKQKLLIQDESIYGTWWCFKEKWERVESDILLLEGQKEKIEFLEKIRTTELDKAQDTIDDESKALSNERANYNKKLDSIIENLIRMLPPSSVGKSKEPIITDLRDLFKEENKFEPFMNFLIAQNIVDKSYSWKTRIKSDAYQSKCACLIKSLKIKGYLKREPSGKEVIVIAENNFQVTIKMDTVKKASPKKYRGFLKMIPKAKDLSPPNPDHSIN